MASEAEKAGRAFELKPFPVLFLIVLAIGLALAGLSQWRVFSRPMVFSGPGGISAAFQKVIYFDEIQYFEADPHFYFTRMEGDSFSMPERVGGDLWAGAARGDSLLLVFKDSFALYKPREDPHELKLGFAGKVPVTWPLVALITDGDGYRALGVKKFRDNRERGELRMLRFRGLEFEETPHTLAYQGVLHSLAAEAVGETSVITYTVKTEGTSKSFLTTYAAGGFSAPRPLDLVAATQTMVRADGELVWLVVEDGAEPGEILRLRYSEGAFVRMTSLNHEWLVDNELRDLAATALGEGFGLLLAGDELAYAEVDAEGAWRGELRQVVERGALGDSAGRSLWNFVAPVVIIIMLVGLFSRARGKLNGAVTKAEGDDGERPARSKPTSGDSGADGRGAASDASASRPVESDAEARSESPAGD